MFTADCSYITRPLLPGMFRSGQLSAALSYKETHGNGGILINHYDSYNQRLLLYMMINIYLMISIIVQGIIRRIGTCDNFRVYKIVPYLDNEEGN